EAAAGVGVDAVAAGVAAAPAAVAVEPDRGLDAADGGVRGHVGHLHAHDHVVALAERPLAAGAGQAVDRHRHGDPFVRGLVDDRKGVAASLLARGDEEENDEEFFHHCWGGGGGGGVFGGGCGGFASFRKRPTSPKLCVAGAAGGAAEAVAVPSGAPCVGMNALSVVEPHGPVVPHD